jgi:hypothetical protein
MPTQKPVQELRVPTVSLFIIAKMENGSNTHQLMNG